MAKPRNRAGSRKLPATPSTSEHPHDEPGGADSEMGRSVLAHRSSGTDGQTAIATAPDPTETWPGEPLYLIAGTGCRHGHEPGAELIERKLGKVPSRSTTRIGVGLIVWLLLGILFLSNLLWLILALFGGATWLLLSAAVQRRTGHRGHCWRTRAWRYAWGGLVPMPRLEDPTREAE